MTNPKLDNPSNTKSSDLSVPNPVPSSGEALRERQIAALSRLLAKLQWQEGTFTVQEQDDFRAALGWAIDALGEAAATVGSAPICACGGPLTVCVDCAVVGSAPPSDAECSCGSENPKSARHGHSHLAWCAVKWHRDGAVGSAPPPASTAAEDWRVRRHNEAMSTSAQSSSGASTGRVTPHMLPQSFFPACGCTLRTEDGERVYVCPIHMREMADTATPERSARLVGRLRALIAQWRRAKQAHQLTANGFALARRSRTSDMENVRAEMCQRHIEQLEALLSPGRADRAELKT